MERTIRCRCLCNREDRQLLGHSFCTRFYESVTTTVNVFIDTFPEPKQHLLNFGQQGALLHLNWKT